MSSSRPPTKRSTERRRRGAIGWCSIHFPLDLDVSKAEEIEKTIRWDTLRIPPTELASWVILQHEWYYRATWDIDFLEARWPFLKACYNALKAGADASFPTHGDETYLHGAFFSLWPDRVGQDAALPADAPRRRARHRGRHAAGA